MLRSLKSIGTIGIATALLAACASPPLDMRPAAAAFDQAPIQNRPVTRPMRAVTSFSESLACMDRMLSDQRVGTTLITSKDIVDPTLRASVATKQMIITTLSQMSRVSNAFRFVDYEMNLLRQDTVQNLTGLLLQSNQMRLQRPELYISGAIAYVDQGVLRSGEQAGTSATRLELGYSADRNATLIGLELHLGDFTTRTLVPGIDSANDIVFGSRSQGLDAAARISRYGVQFNMSRSTVMGAGAAVRTLVELGLIEIVGKWARVPYWQCLMLERTTPAFERQFKEWFDASDPSIADAPGLASPQRRIYHAKRALAEAGYYADEPNGQLTPNFRRAIAQYQSDQNLIPSGELTFPTFQRLFQKYVRLNDDGTLARVGWGNTNSQPKTPIELRLSIANQKFKPDEFTLGERIYLTATVSREAYLSCYYQEPGGKVSRLFPNQFQRQTALPGNRVVRIPDWLSPNPGFNLRAAEVGIAQVDCYASPFDIADEMPEPMRGSALKPIDGIDSLDAVSKAFAATAANPEITRSSLKWHIRQTDSSAATLPPASEQAKTDSKATSQPQAKINHASVHQLLSEKDNLAQVAAAAQVPIRDLNEWQRICSNEHFAQMNSSTCQGFGVATLQPNQLEKANR